MRSLRRRIFLAVLLAPALLSVGAAPAPKTVRLVTIGNSFSNNATRFLGDLAKAAGHVLIHQPMAVGGASMKCTGRRSRRTRRTRRMPRASTARRA